MASRACWGVNVSFKEGSGVAAESRFCDVDGVGYAELCFPLRRAETEDEGMRGDVKCRRWLVVEPLTKGGCCRD